jgi:hypothetical protein
MELKEEIDMEVGRESLTYLGTVENISILTGWPATRLSSSMMPS